VLVLTETSLSNFHFFSGFPVLLFGLKERQKKQNFPFFLFFLFYPFDELRFARDIFLERFSIG